MNLPVLLLFATVVVVFYLWVAEGQVKVDYARNKQRQSPRRMMFVHKVGCDYKTGYDDEMLAIQTPYPSVCTSWQYLYPEKSIYKNAYPQNVKSCLDVENMQNSSRYQYGIAYQK
jgi:hypothetical protein